MAKVNTPCAAASAADYVDEATALALEALALILAAGDLNDSGGNLVDVSGRTDKKSRITALALMASEKTAKAIEAMNAAAEELIHE